MKLFKKSAMVKGSSIQTGAVQPAQKPHQKRKVFKFLLLLLVILLGAGGYAYYQGRNAPIANPNACSKGISMQASPYLGAAKNQELKPIVKKILGTKDFDKDSACNLILTQYYINISDPKNARLYYDKLMQQVKPNEKTEVMLGSVVFLEKQTTGKSNVIYLGENK